MESAKSEWQKLVMWSSTIFELEMKVNLGIIGHINYILSYPIFIKTIYLSEYLIDWQVQDYKLYLYVLQWVTPHQQQKEKKKKQETTHTHTHAKQNKNKQNKQQQSKLK